MREKEKESGRSFFAQGETDALSVEAELVIECQFLRARRGAYGEINKVICFYK